MVHIDVGRRARDGRQEVCADASSLTALSAARAIASSWGATLHAVAIVAADAAAAALPTLRAELTAAGADRILIATVPHEPLPLWASLGAAWQLVLDQIRPRLVLFGADAPSASELASRTGARLGARLLARARVSTSDQVELRDPDGTNARASDSGAAVATIGTDLAAARFLARIEELAALGRAHTNPDIARTSAPAAVDVHADTSPVPTGPDDLTDPNGTALTFRPGIEVTVLATKAPVDDRVEVVGTGSPEVRHARRLVVALGSDALADVATAAATRKLGARLGAVVVEAGSVDEAIALSPELYLQVGAAVGDLAGASSIVRLGVHPEDRRKGDDGALPAPLAAAVSDLARALTEIP